VAITMYFNLKAARCRARRS